MAATAMIWTGLLDQGNSMLANTALNIAHTKISIDMLELFIRGVLCNTLVCLAIWLCLAAHDVASKILAIVFPISAFVALGFEHSVANMYFIPLAMMIHGSEITAMDLLYNLLPVTLGNIVGGSLFVALVYWLVYLKK